jgi:hypothetical protein
MGPSTIFTKTILCNGHWSEVDTPFICIPHQAQGEFFVVDLEIILKAKKELEAVDPDVWTA